MTITATPSAYSSVHSDLIYTVTDPKTSDPILYPNYKFIGDVYIGATLVARLKRVQDPVTGVGIFNVGQAVRNYLATIFNPTPAVLVAQTLGNGNFSLLVQMKFGEEYTGTTTLDIVTDSARVYYNNYNNRNLGVSTLAGKLNDVASNGPATRYAFSNSAFYFVPYFPTSGSAVSYSITPVGGGNVYASTFTPASLEMQVLNLSPLALNALSSGTINSSTTQYTVVIGGETLVFKIICEAIYNPYTVHFLNQYGGFESFIFPKVSRNPIDIQSKDFGKLPYSVDGSGVVSYKNSNNVYNETVSTYSKQFRERMILNSDVLTDAEYRWLQELVLSTMVYLEDSGSFYPVKVAASNYEALKIVNDDLNNLTINIEFGNQLQSQQR